MKARRYELTDKEWELVRPLIQISHTGRPQKDIRAHLNGILWLARSGARWSDLPARFGPHQTVYSCFCRRRDDGTLKKIFELCAAPGTGTELSMDSTSIKASVQAGRGIRKRAKLSHQAAIGKTRGGLNTIIHAIVGKDLRPVAFLLSAGNVDDCTEAVPLLKLLPDLKDCDKDLIRVKFQKKCGEELLPKMAR